MQRAPLGVLVCLGALGSVGASTAAVEQNPFFGGMKPTTRVVELLKYLKDQCEADAKVDESLYEKFVCWGRQVIKQKTETNAVATQEINELTQYIADLDAGRIELTTERTDLEKEISGLSSDIETATAQRDKERTDFENAEAEMTQAIEALSKALQVLRAATADHTTGVLAEVRVQAGQRANHEAKELSIRQRAVELGDRFLGKGDALFLRRLLIGEVPVWDWKKLNRKATFKMSYKARSFEIQDVLAKLLETFGKNKEEATSKEKEAQEAFDMLMAEKNGQLDSAKEALAKMEKENGAKALSKADTQARIDLLTEQVANDEKYIKQVEGELAEKKVEWEARSKLRYGEIQAIGEAISILHNDDARDLFKKSFESQGYSFLQTGQRDVERGAAAALRAAARQTKDRRLLALLQDFRAAASPFGKLAERFTLIIGKIDSILTMLQEEEAMDTAKKETCEKSRADNTREAIKLSRDIDENTDTMTRLMSEVEKLDAEIKENQDAIEALEEQLQEATEQRTEENTAYLKDKADDEEGAETVQRAYDVLEGFYKDSGLMLLQRRSAEPVPVQAGQAPPPPPTTWDSPYGGRTADSTGILAILSMIKEDILRDIASADAAELKAKEAYDALAADLNAEKVSREEDITTMSQEKAGKLGEHTDTESARATSKSGLDVTLKMIADLEPTCNYFTVNFPVRVKNRQIETDGLEKAKAILKGAVFPEGESLLASSAGVRPKEPLPPPAQERSAAVRSHA